MPSAILGGLRAYAEVIPGDAIRVLPYADKPQTLGVTTKAQGQIIGGEPPEVRRQWARSIA